ncbi:MAG: EAL domain-containing protein [Nitriliruptoraceae bacterium]|nr:EAL domain-containing protein [Nitriliruptoraceae bacterium]
MAWANGSFEQLTEGFALQVLAPLAAADVAPARLGLEVTESVFERDLAVVVGEVSHLRRAGVRIGLDDSGTGYSSLSRPRSLPIDLVKIDQSFMTALDSPPGRATVAAIVALAAAIDAQTIAEGVESSRQVQVLRQLGSIWSVASASRGRSRSRSSPRSPARAANGCGSRSSTAGWCVVVGRSHVRSAAPDDAVGTARRIPRSISTSTR